MENRAAKFDCITRQVDIYDIISLKFNKGNIHTKYQKVYYFFNYQVLEISTKNAWLDNIIKKFASMRTYSTCHLAVGHGGIEKTTMERDEY